MLGISATRRGSTTAALAAGLAALLAMAPARAGGLWLNEFGTPAMGRAGAGAEAGVDDASASLHNPASMTRLAGHQILVGAQLIARGMRFIDNPANDIFSVSSASPVWNYQ